MFRGKSVQTSIFDVEMQAGPEKVARLKSSWAGPFRQYALPLLLEFEPQLACYYHERLGAPSKPGALMLGLVILKEMFDLTDAEALERLDFDLSWHYALDVTPTETYVCPKTLFNFRKHLEKSRDARKVFNSLIDKLIKQWSIHTTRHRLDSTHILSNMKVLTRLGLFVRTIEMFLRQLHKMPGELVASLPKRFRENYLERKGYFADVKSSEAPRRLSQCAKDLWYLIDRFRGTPAVSALKMYRVMVRLFADQCIVIEQGKDETGNPILVPQGLVAKPDGCAAGECEVELKPNSEQKSDSLQSPTDTDATYSGHKGKGYQAQLGETCHADNPFQVIDYVQVEGAHNSDQNASEPFHEELRSRGLEPKDTYADFAYNSGKNVVSAKEKGINLKGPMSGVAPGRLTLGHFQFNDDWTEVVSCPAGNAPLRHAPSETEEAINAWFDLSKCKACPHYEKCPVRTSHNTRFLSFRRTDVAVGLRRCEQETEAFKDEYKIRSGIEATNSTLKNKRGMGRLRVRGAPAVEFVTVFKVLGENFSRMVNYVLAATRMDCCSA
jgi:hypothetical protein